MTAIRASLAIAACAVLGVTACVRAGDMAVELETLGQPLLLDTHFANFGRKPAKYSGNDGAGVRFSLTTARIENQFGLYSLFGLTGDFEISATYRVPTLSAPTTGYGVSFGIVVDTQDSAGIVSLARGRRPKEADGYLITRGTGRESERSYATTHVPSSAKVGRLVVKREKAEIVCLAADNLKDEPIVIGRQEFSDGPVRQIRLFADSGGAPAGLDAILSGIRIRAEAISGDLPRRESSHALAWWLGALAIAMTAAVVVVVLRRRSSERG